MADKLPPIYIAANNSLLLTQDAIVDRIVINLGENPGNGFVLTTGSTATLDSRHAILTIQSFAAVQGDVPMQIDIRTPVLAGQKLSCVYAGAHIFFS